MDFRTGTRCPAKVRSRIYKAGTILQVVTIGLQRWNGKAPDIAFDYRAVGFNLIDPLVISRTRQEAVRDRISGKTDNKKHLNLVALECVTGTFIYISKIIAEINIM